MFSKFYGADAKGYLIPDPVNPQECQCIRVYVPKSFLYITAFWTAYEFFTTWIAWARDPLKRGKQAAQVWRACYDKARAEWLTGKGCDVAITNIRQNPNDACALELSEDGGITWVKFADIGKCSSCGGSHGAMQYDGINVNIYNDCTGEFEPSGEPFDPSKHGIYDSLWSPDTSGACNGAANIAAWVTDIADKSLQALADGATVGGAVELIIGALSGLAGAGNLFQLLLSTTLVLITENGDLLGDAVDVDIKAITQDVIFRHIESDGTLREPDFTDMVHEMFDQRDAQTIDTPERVKWGHVTNIMSILGPYVLSRQNKWAGITDAVCDETWSETFDFLTSKDGWFNIPEVDNPDGKWVKLSGWLSTIGLIGFGRTVNTLRLQMFIPARTITHVEFTYDVVPGDDHASPTNNRYFVGHDGDDLSLYDVALLTPATGRVQWDGTQLLSEIRLGVQVSTTETPPATVAGSGKITSVTVRGLGENPFA